MISILLAGLLSTATVPNTERDVKAPVLESFEDAETYLGLRGLLLAGHTKGVHATREGKTLYDEMIYSADGGPISAFRFEDAAKATEMESTLREHNKGALSLVRGRFVFMTDDPVIAAAIAQPRATLATGPVLQSLDEVDALLAERGFHVAKKRPATKTAIYEMQEYTIDTLDGDAAINVYRFADEVAAARFRSALTPSSEGRPRRAITMGHVVFVVPDTDDAGALFDRLASN